MVPGPGDLLPRLLRAAGRRWPPRSPSCSWCSCSRASCRSSGSPRDGARDRRAAARRWTGRVLLVAADGGHAPAVRQPVRHRAAPVRHLPGRAGLAERARSGATSSTRSRPRTWARCCAPACSSCSASCRSRCCIGDHGRLRPRPPADARRAGSVFLAVPARPDPAVRGHHHAALLPDAGPRPAQHPVGDHPAADRAVHAVRGVLDAGPLRQRARRALRGRADRRRAAPGSCSGASTCRWPCRRSRRWRSCCSCGPGTSSCSPSCSSTTPPSGPWPARSAPSRASGAPTSRCCAPGRC